MFMAMISWLTPSVLFCALNLIIATLFVTSKFKNQAKKEEGEEEEKTGEDVKFLRAPSLLERVKSIKLTFQPDPSPQEAADRVEPSYKDEEKTDEHVRKIKSLPPQEAPVERQGKMMTKSASEKKIEVKEEVVVERRRPATVRERKTASDRGDKTVDEKADDFIHKFKQHLKLQRIDSILRNRGVGR